MSLDSRSKTMELKALNAKQRDYLEKLVGEFPMISDDPDDTGIPIYVRVKGKFYFLPEVRVTFKRNSSKHIAKTAPEGIYKGGGGCFIKSQYGTLVVPDERGGGLGVEWYKYWPVGLGRYEDGEDLLKTVKREFDEEVFIYSLDHKYQYVPKGGLHRSHCEALDFKVEETIEFGEMVVHRFFVNEPVRAYELHAVWDITRLKEPYSAHYDEDHWFRGGRPGIPVVALCEHGNVKGFFSGQQGFIRLPPKANLHPSVASFLGLPAPTKRT